MVGNMFLRVSVVCVISGSFEGDGASSSISEDAGNASLVEGSDASLHLVMKASITSRKQKYTNCRALINTLHFKTCCFDDSFKSACALDS